jgi:hypothetical protein
MEFEFELFNFFILATMMSTFLLIFCRRQAPDLIDLICVFEASFLFRTTLEWILFC